VLDDERLLGLYGEIRDLGLVLLCHTGFDMAFERRRIADPARVVRLVETVPDLRLVVTHLGAWEDWDEVEALIIGRPITTDVAFTAGYLDKARMRSMLMRHPAEHLLFGSDSPWAEQGAALEELRSLDLPPDLLRAMLRDNARRILRLPG
jgi:predicted TIM-barrel fold metal-dependent hydrolase